MKISVIDNYDSFVYNLVRYVREVENCEVNVMRNDQIDWNALKEADGILLSPGPGIPSEAGKLMSVIEEFHLSKKMLGVCLGHQALGSFFGMELYQSEPFFHGKSSQIIHDGSKVYENIPTEFEVGRYHSWMIRQGKDNSPIKVNATGPEGEIMGIKHNELPIFGVQYHPESILTPKGRQFINNWITL
jgi:anthranilate synthase component 2